MRAPLRIGMLLRRGDARSPVYPVTRFFLSSLRECTGLSRSCPVGAQENVDATGLREVVAPSRVLLPSPKRSTRVQREREAR